MSLSQGWPGISASAGTPEAGEVLTIVSGKGGVGKTNLALNLGIQLERRGRRVILVDADFGMANIDILLNISPRGEVTDLLDPRCHVDHLLDDGPEGMRVLCGVSGASRDEALELDPRRLAQAVRRLAKRCDVLLIDCGAGINKYTEAFAGAADRIVLITTPEPTALADAYATLKVLHSRDLLTRRVGAVVSMVPSERVADDVYDRLCRAAAHFLGREVEDLGYVCHDRHVPAAVLERVPVTIRSPRCAASVCFDAIAQKLLPGGAVRAGRGLWSRVSSLFL